MGLATRMPRPAAPPSSSIRRWPAPSPAGSGPPTARASPPAASPGCPCVPGTGRCGRPAGDRGNPPPPAGYRTGRGPSSAPISMPTLVAMMTRSRFALRLSHLPMIDSDSPPVTIHESRVTSVQVASSYEVTSRLRRSIRPTAAAAFRSISWVMAAHCRVENGNLEVLPVNQWQHALQE